MYARAKLIALLLVSVSLFAIATWAGIATIENTHELAIKDQQQASSNRQINLLIAELGVERRIAATNQRAVLNYAHRVSAQNAGLVGWLHRQRLRPPKRFIIMIPTPVFESASTSSSTPTTTTTKGKKHPKR